MTDTTPLSPAAQAVLQAACIHHGLFNEEIVQRRRNIAGALRAAAIELRKAYVNDLDFHSADQWLDALAAELEGAQ